MKLTSDHFLIFKPCFTKVLSALQGSTEKYLVPAGSRASSYAGNIAEGGYLTESSLSPSVASFLPNGNYRRPQAAPSGVDEDDGNSVASQQLLPQTHNPSNATKPKNNSHHNNTSPRYNHHQHHHHHHHPGSIRPPPTTPCSTDVNEESERERFLVNGDDNEAEVAMLGPAARGGARGGIHASLPRKSTRRSRRTRNQMHFGGSTHLIRVERKQTSNLFFSLGFFSEER